MTAQAIRNPRFQDAGGLYNTLVDEFHLNENQVEVNLRAGALVVRIPEFLYDRDLPAQFRQFQVVYDLVV